MKNDSQVFEQRLIESRLWKVSTAEAFQLYNLLQDELEYIIKRIKKRPQVTKNNYGDYMVQIVELHKITSLNYKVIAELLKLAGGNINGINDAMRVINI